MKALILAAGFGKRLLPFSQTVPKPLMPILNTPMIDFTIASLLEAGVEEIFINLHHQGQQIKTHVEKSWRKKLAHINFLVEPEILGTGGAVLNARHYLEQAPFLVINADVIAKFDFPRLIRFHRQSQAAATMVVRSIHPHQNVNPVYTDERFRIQQIGGHPPEKSMIFHFACAQILDPIIFQYLTGKTKSCLIKDGYFNLLQDNLPVFGMPHCDYWNDIGDPALYYATNYQLINRVGQSIGVWPLSPRLQECDVRLDINQNMIGEGVQIETSLLRQCIIGNQAQLLGTSTLSGCIVMPGSIIFSGTNLKNVVTDGVSMVQMS